MGRGQARSRPLARKIRQSGRRQQSQITSALGFKHALRAFMQNTKGVEHKVSDWLCRLCDWTISKDLEQSISYVVTLWCDYPNQLNITM